MRVVHRGRGCWVTLGTSRHLADHSQIPLVRWRLGRSRFVLGTPNGDGVSDMPRLKICASVGLRLAPLAAVLACALAAPVLLHADWGRNVSILPWSGESSPGPKLAGQAYRCICTAVLRDSVFLRRSLSRCADRAETLARKLCASKRRADRLARENAELRARLAAVSETVRALAETIPAISPQPATAGSVTGGMRTATHVRELGRNAYPPPLPISGTQPAHSHSLRLCCRAAPSRAACDCDCWALQMRSWVPIHHQRARRA